MSEQVVIDPLRFAREGESLERKIAVANLDRLHDRLAGTDGEIRYRLAGLGGGAAKRSALRLQIEGEFSLICQRCLERLAFPLSVDETLLLARNEAELAAWEDADPTCEGLVAEAQMDVQGLVEDAILLALPMVPKHPEGECPAE